jgi:hypothetical protein
VSPFKLVLPLQLRRRGQETTFEQSNQENLQEYLLIMSGIITFKSKGHDDVSIEGPPLAGLIWKSMGADFSALVTVFLEFFS